MSTVLVVNGPNLNLLGRREPEIYGTKTLKDLESELETLAESLGVGALFFQSNSEGAIIDFIQEHGYKAMGMVINPGAFTHYSYAIRDAVSAVGVATIEVHLSNLYSREQFRRQSAVAGACIGQISGLGFGGYRAALRFLVEKGREG